ncbi:MAG: YccF domain-containing protein [Burkholderiales bacterium]|nr:YccF domain-containing protein [Burkholderiales bacterium]
MWLSDYTCNIQLCVQQAGGVTMRAIGNFLWFILGGVLMGLAWWFIGLLAFVTIVGIPWGKACFVLGQFAFFPFGREAISRKELKQKDDIGTGSLGLLGNIIWFIFAGVWLAIGHILSALVCFITIIGIPFGIQHLKLAGIALTPIGKTIVTKEVAAAARKANAEAAVSALRSGT